MKFKNIFFLIISVTAFNSCQSQLGADLPGIKEIYKNDFLVGAAIEDHQLNSIPHTELLKKQFNSITAENDMKPESIQPHEGQFTFNNADKIANFARENNIKLRGHTLLWHRQTPKWFFIENDKTVSKETLKKRLQTHITKLMQRYKGQIYAWDVVNEAIDPDTSNGYRKSQWYDILGPEYIELAFRYAKKADPAAKLYYNDYNTTDQRKRDIIIKMINNLKAKGVSIDGIGMQMHINTNSPSIQNFKKALREFSEQGLDIQITELDISVYNNNDEFFKKIAPEILNAQGHRVKYIFNTIKKYKKNISSVTFWGMADDHTWLKFYPVKRENWPLPFDSNLKAKPFYWGMANPEELAPLKEIPAPARKKNSTPAGTAFAGTAIIDGKPDKAYKKSPILPIKIFIQGIADEKNIFEGASGESRVLWDEKALYIYTQVKDSKLSIASDLVYKQDSVEIFIDENNKKTGYYEEDDAQFRINYKNETSFGSTGNRKGFKSACKLIKGGYIVEIRIPFTKITAKDGTIIGFDLQINDDQGSGQRDSISKWFDKSNNSWQSTAGYGSLILKKQ